MNRHIIKVIFQDDYFCVVNKPSGVLVIPSPKNEKNTLIHRVNADDFLPELKSKLHPCHRIDRDTSGILVFAKGKSNQKKMMDLFKERQVQKTYLAFVHGYLNEPEGELRGSVAKFDPSKRHSSYKGRKPYRNDQQTKLAITRYKVAKKHKNFSVVEVFPVTGRTNQIRIQFSQIKHPLLGERKYAFAKDFQLKFRRCALHASCLEWTHPITKEKIKVECSLSEDMKKFLTNQK